MTTIGLTALILDDSAAYYIAVGVLIVCALVAARLGLLTARRPILVCLLLLAGCVAYIPLVHLHWFASYQYWKRQAPIWGPIDPSVDDMLAFKHPWCQSWTDLRYGCFRKPAPSWVTASKSEIVESDTAVCRLGDAPSRRQVQCSGAAVPRWCIIWWDGVGSKWNPRYRLGPHEERLIEEDTLIEARQWPKPTLAHPIGRCELTIWD